MILAHIINRASKIYLNGLFSSYPLTFNEGKEGTFNTVIARDMTISSSIQYRCQWVNDQTDDRGMAIFLSLHVMNWDGRIACQQLSPRPKCIYNQELPLLYMSSRDAGHFLSFSRRYLYLLITTGDRQGQTVVCVVPLQSRHRGAIHEHLEMLSNFLPRAICAMDFLLAY